MDTRLLKIQGLKIDTNSFPKLSKIGDILFLDGPLMSVFTDKENNPYIYDWVDCDESVNRWLVYEVNVSTLKMYLNNEIPHFSLLNQPTNDLIFVVDYDQHFHINQICITSPRLLPYSYLPKYNIFHDEEDSPDTKVISDHFSLYNNKNSLSKEDSFDILNESLKSDSEIFNLHLTSESLGVGKGYLKNSVLSSVLNEFQKLTESTSVNLFGYNDKNKTEKKKPKLINEYKGLGDFDFYFTKAASFGIFFRPSNSQLNLFGDYSPFYEIIESILELTNNSVDLTTLKKIKYKYSDEVLNNFKSFIKTIESKRLDISLQYGNNVNKVSRTTHINHKKAKLIFNNFTDLNLEEITELKFDGRFKALDAISGKFKFEVINNEMISGTFADYIRTNIYQYNLIDNYSITIKRKKFLKSGKKTFEEKDELISVK